jgi:hypothetical protein
VATCVPDSYYPSTTPVNNALLLNFNGANGSTTFTDSSPNALVPANIDAGACLTTDPTKRTFGTAAGDFSASNNSAIRYAASNALRLIGPFTIRFTWIPASSGLVNRYFFTLYNPSAFSIWLYTNGSGFISCYAGSSPSSTISPVEGTKYYIVVTRDSLNAFRWYVNGQQQPNLGAGTFDHVNPTICEIGATPTIAGPNAGYPCYIDDLQILSGFYSIDTGIPTAQATQPQPQTIDSPRTVLSLHADSLTDSAGFRAKTVALAGTASVSTAEKKFGTGSFLVPNTGSSTLNGVVVTDSDDFDFQTGDFTFDCWAYRSANTYTGTLFYYSETAEFSFTVNTSGEVIMNYRSSGGTQASISTGLTFPLNAWQYVVVQRRGTNFEVYLHGAAPYTTAITGGASSTVNSGGDLFIGRTNASSALGWNGYIDEFRVTKGAARRTGAFTVPTLLNCDSTTGEPDFTPAPAPAPPPSPAPAPPANQFRLATVGITATVGVALPANTTSDIARIISRGGSTYGGEAIDSFELSGNPPGISTLAIQSVLTPFANYYIRASGTPTLAGTYDLQFRMIDNGEIVGGGVVPITVLAAVDAFDTGVVLNSTALTVGAAANVLLAEPELAVSATVTITGEPYWFTAFGISIDLTWTPGTPSTGELRITGTPTARLDRPELITVSYIRSGSPIGYSYHSITIAP